jgi:hypothetical protein
MPAPTRLPPPTQPRARTGRDGAGLLGAGGVRGAVTAKSSAEMALLIGTAVLAGSGLLGSGARWLFGHARPNNQNSAAYRRASVAYFCRPTPRVGSPRAVIAV